MQRRSSIMYYTAQRQHTSHARPLLATRKERLLLVLVPTIGVASHGVAALVSATVDPVIAALLVLVELNCFVNSCAAVGLSLGAGALRFFAAACFSWNERNLLGRSENPFHVGGAKFSCIDVSLSSDPAHKRAASTGCEMVTHIKNI